MIFNLFHYHISFSFKNGEIQDFDFLKKNKMIQGCLGAPPNRSIQQSSKYSAVLVTLQGPDAYNIAGPDQELSQRP